MAGSPFAGRWPTQEEIIRLRVLAEWRRLPQIEKPLETWSQIGGLVRDEIRSLGMEEALISSRLLELWPAVVGEFIASHTKAETLRSGELVVRVGQPTLRFELERNLRPAIVTRLNEALGGIFVRSVKFLHG